MGHLAEAMARFAQPLIDATDGSPEDLQRALSLAQLCWNLAVIPETQREQSLAAMQPTLKMTDEEFQEFKNGVFMPMVRRHQEMFPQMQHREMTDRPGPLGGHAMSPSATKRPAKKYAGTGRNERCPCGSGRKYKICCGR